MSWHLPSLITRYQETFLQCHRKCPKPVMATISTGAALAEAWTSPHCL